MGESRRTEQVKRSLTADIFNDLKNKFHINDERAIAKLLASYNGDVNRMLGTVTKQLKDIENRYLNPANKFPDVGYYFELELKPRDVSPKKLDVQIINWRLTDYAQGYDEDFVNFTESKRRSHVSKGGSPYTIQPGDSLWKISREVYGRGSFWNEIYQKNIHLIGKNPNYIFVGIPLEIPTLLVPGFPVPSGMEDRSARDHLSQIPAKKLSSPPIGAMQDTYEFPIYPGLIGNKIYAGKLTFSFALKLQDSQYIKNPASITLSPYTKQITSTFQLLHMDFTFNLGSSLPHVLSLDSRIFNTESFEIKLGAKPGNTFTGTLEKKGLKFNMDGFFLELDMKVQAELTAQDKPNDPPSSVPVPISPTVPSATPSMWMTSIIILGMIMYVLTGGASFADRRKFEDLEDNPELWARAQREIDKLKT